MISEHTKLMNCIIGLTKNDDKYPSILREHKYILDLIEPFFKNKDNENINPDLLLTSRKHNHCIFVECKGGNSFQEHDKKQKEKYDKVEKQDFIHIVDNPESQKITFNFAFVLSENLSKYIDTAKFLDKNHPVILHLNSHFVLSKTHGTFCKKEINDLFNSGIYLDKKFPTNYYPFGCDDKEEHIIRSVLQTIIHFALKNRAEFTIEEILSESHELWKRFDEPHKAKMRDKLKNIMNSENFSKIKEYVKVSKDKCKVNTRSLQSLQDACQKLIEKINYDSKQQKLL